MEGGAKQEKSHKTLQRNRFSWMYPLIDPAHSVWGLTDSGSIQKILERTIEHLELC